MPDGTNGTKQEASAGDEGRKEGRKEAYPVHPLYVLYCILELIIDIFRASITLTTIFSTLYDQLGYQALRRRWGGEVGGHRGMSTFELNGTILSQLQPYRTRYLPNNNNTITATCYVGVGTACIIRRCRWRGFPIIESWLSTAGFLGKVG